MPLQSSQRWALWKGIYQTVETDLRRGVERNFDWRKIIANTKSTTCVDIPFQSARNWGIFNTLLAQRADAELVWKMLQGNLRMIHVGNFLLTADPDEAAHLCKLYFGEDVLFAVQSHISAHYPGYWSQRVNQREAGVLRDISYMYQ